MELDNDIKNLALSIRQKESGGDYNSVGKSGEYGGYQFLEDTWNSMSKKYGINVPLRSATPEQQNEVVYNQIKEWKDSNYNIGQIASMWNAGESEPDAYLGTFKTTTGKHKAGDPSFGTTPSGVSYDVPVYANAVADDFQERRGASVTTPTSITPPTPLADTDSEEDIISKLSGRATKIGESLSDLSNLMKGQKGSEKWWTEILNTGGAIGGGVGDIFGSVLNTVSLGGLSKAEDWVGGYVSKAVDTEVGKSIVNVLSTVAKEYPEATTNTGNIFNMVTAIPIMKGFGVIKDIGKSALYKSVLPAIRVGVKKDIETAIEKAVSDKAVKLILEEGLVTTEKVTFGENVGKLLYRVADIGQKELFRRIPLILRNEIDDILTTISQKPIFWTPGKILQAIEHNAGNIGLGTGALIGVGGGPIAAAFTSGAGGLMGAFSKNLVKKITRKFTENAIKQAPRVSKLGLRRKSAKTSLIKKAEEAKVKVPNVSKVNILEKINEVPDVITGKIKKAPKTSRYSKF